MQMTNIHVLPSIAGKISSMLLEIGAIKLNPEQPFTWSSGLKSPIYCDNRISLSYPKVRTFIKDELVNIIKVHFSKVQAIAGVATAGIPQGTLIADALNIPFIYVRSSPKGHGMENLIEGKVEKGIKLVVVEDLVSTGGSSLKAVEAIRNAGMEVLGMVAIFSYGFELAEENFKRSGTTLYCLSDYEYLLQQAIEKNYISESDLELLSSWRTSPGTWISGQSSNRINP
jgi:orotate phosphoribosyltransferase